MGERARSEERPVEAAARAGRRPPGALWLVVGVAALIFGLGSLAFGRQQPEARRPQPPTPTARALSAAVPPATARPAATLVAVAAASPTLPHAPAAPTASPPASPNPPLPAGFGADAILARASQAVQDPETFGLRSFYGTVAGQGGWVVNNPQDPFAPWQQEVWFAAPDHQRVQVAGGGTFVTDGTAVWQYDPAARSATVQDPDALRLGFPVYGVLDLAALRLPVAANYVLHLASETVAGRPAYHLEWTPPPGSPPETKIRRVAFWIDQQTYLPLGTEQDVWTPVRIDVWAWHFTRLEINPALPADLFAFRPPPGVALREERRQPPLTAAEQAALAAAWARLAGQVAYPLFQPAGTPAWLRPGGDPRLDAAAGTVGQVYHSATDSQALQITEGPARGPLPGTGAPSPVGSLAGRYQEAGGGRQVVFDRDGTRITLRGEEAVTPTLLLRLAAGMQPVAGPALPATPADSGAGTLASPAAPAGTLLPPVPPVQVLELRFVDALHGWAFGGAGGGSAAGRPTLSATTDGGRTWQGRPVPAAAIGWPNAPEGTAGVSGVRFADARNGWLFGPGLYTTHDGGHTWTDDSALGAVLALEPQGDSVWVLIRPCAGAPAGSTCSPRLFVSRDAGRTWARLPVAALFAGAGQLVRVTGQDAFVLSYGNYGGAAPGPIGRLAVTHDGGQHWTELADRCVGTGGLEDRLAATPGGQVWLLCGGEPGAGAQQKALFVSPDWGQHWSRQTGAPTGQHDLPVGGYIGTLAVSAPDHGWLALDRGDLYRSTDAGRTWTEALPFAEANPGDSTVGPVLFADALDGWLVTPAQLFGTTDGGGHWVRLPAP